MCAPAENLVQKCAKRSSSLSKSSTSSTFGTPRNDPSHIIGRRASGDTSLCGISLRGQSASACQGNPGFVEVTDKGRKVLQWKNWGEFSLAGNECDHLVELQLVKAALEGAKFCDAWNGMLDVVKNQADTAVSPADLTAAFATLKNAANDNRGLHYLAKDVNGQKNTFVASVIRKRGAVHGTTTIGSPVVAYIKKLTPVGNTIAADIDLAAVTALGNLKQKAILAYTTATTQEEKDVYALALLDEMEKATGHDDEITAVSTYWVYLRGST